MSVSNGGATSERRTTAPTARGRKPAVVWPYMRVRGANGADALNRGRCESPDWDWFRASSNDDDASVLERATEVELCADDARSGSWVGGARIVEPQPDGTPRPMLRGSMPLRLAFTLVTAVDTVRGERERDVTHAALYSVAGVLESERVDVRAEAPRVAVRVFDAVKRLPTKRRANEETGDVERWSTKELAWIPCGRIVDGRPMRAVRIGNATVFAAYAADTATRYAGPSMASGTARIAVGTDAKGSHAEWSAAAAFAELARNEAAELAREARSARERATALVRIARGLHAAGYFGISESIARTLDSDLDVAYQRAAVAAKAAEAAEKAAEAARIEASAAIYRAVMAMPREAREAPTVVPRGGSALETAPRTYVTPCLGAAVTEPAAPDERTLRANPRIPAMAPSTLRAALDPEAVTASVRADAALAAERRAHDAAVAAKVAAKRAGKKHAPQSNAVATDVRKGVGASAPLRPDPRIATFRG